MLILILFSPAVPAGGVWLYALGTPDLGTAAGRAALAKDAAAAAGIP